MCYSQVTIAVTNRGERRDAWFAFSSHHETIEEQFAEIRDTGFLIGTRYDTRLIGTGPDREVVDQYSTMISRDIVVSISEMRFKMVSAQGEEITP